MRFRDWGSKLQKLRDERGNQCQYIYENGKRCISRIKLQFAHIKATACIGRGRGQSRRYYDIKKFPDCYRLMCRTHHKRFDIEYWKYREEAPF